LFEGIDCYLSVLRTVTGVVFVTSHAPGAIRDAEFEAWRTANISKLAAARAAQQDFIAESFALDTLCGAVLQVAEKAIAIYSTNIAVPAHLMDFLGPNQRKFCVGRPIRTVPLGLVIHAARNQHTHFNDSKLRELNATVFRLLATEHGYGPSIGGITFVDPAFDLSNPGLLSYASNVTSLINWRTYAEYIADMKTILAT
jgi:hypothetical protein